MVNVAEAKTLLLDGEPLVERIEDYIVYHDVYLFRVKFISEDESNYDPFFSVHIQSGKVKDFSVLHDGDISEIADLFAKNTGRRK